ncbi:hypothetical protein ACKKBF_B11000 [Auxenochlorella protothecoides x Auxenochlorella symbiontica]|uniref:Methyltransferase type 12 domain-containing protein n=2 Tax=Auxenochlorella protothecoides TaxID=3075 RepID=A0A1D2AB46_AUXPR
MDLARCPQVPAATAAVLEEDAARYWDLFYQRNAGKFFKDRHYLDREFPLLLTAPCILELGCGVGNTLFPLAAANTQARLYACDFAPAAIRVLKQHPLYGGRVTAHVADITKGPLAPAVPEGQVSAATLFFVLSALSPETMPRALENLKPSLVPGGRVLVRDYARGDLAQSRLSEPGRVQRLADDFYVRWDGTRAFYFTQEGMRSLFKGAGFVCESLSCQSRHVENRKKGLAMRRLFIQGVFRLPEPGEARQPFVDERTSALKGVINDSTPGEGHGQADSAGACAVQGTPGPQPLQAWSWGGFEVQTPAGHDASAAQALGDLAALLAPGLAGQTVLEWSAGETIGLAALCALRHCRSAIAAASSQACLPSLRANTKLNSHRVVIERLRLHALESSAGDGHLEAVWRAHPSGLDLMLLHLDDASHLLFTLHLMSKLLKAGAGRAWLVVRPGLLERVEAGMVDWPHLQQCVGGAPGVAAIEECRHVRVLEVRKH